MSTFESKVTSPQTATPQCHLGGDDFILVAAIVRVVHVDKIKAVLDPGEIRGFEH